MIRPHLIPLYRTGILVMGLLVAAAGLAAWGGSSQTASAQGSPITYSSPGGYSWTAPAGVVQVSVRILGGGGGGGTGQGPSGGGCDCVTGLPGQAGQVINQTVTVTPGTAYSVTVGGGGPGYPGSPGCYMNNTWWPPSNGGYSYFNGTGAAGGTGGYGYGGATAYSGIYSYPGYTNGSGYGSGGYSNSCNNPGGPGQAGAVTITPTAIMNISAAQNPAPPAGTTLTWSTQNVDAGSCYITNPSGATILTGNSGSGPSGSVSTSPATFTLRCTLGGAPVTAQTSFNIIGSPGGSITVNGQTAPLTIRVGTPTAFRALFTLASNDSGVASDIFGSSTNPGGETGARPATPSSVYASPKDYAITLGPGNYTYYARQSTSAYPDAVNYAEVSVNVRESCATNGRTVEGWGWSDIMGWVSASCIGDSLSPFDYGLEVDAEGVVTGYAWSDTLGWIRPAQSGDSCPGSGVRLDRLSKKFSGWLKVTSLDGEWDGCISMSCENTGTCETSNYIVKATSNNLISGTDFTNAAWGSTGIGWVAFDLHCAPTPAVCATETSYTRHRACFGETVQCVGDSVCGTGQGCVSPTGTNAGCLNISSQSCTPENKSVRVRKGATSQLYWNVTGVENNCSIAGSNGQNLSNLLTEGTNNDAGTFTTTAITNSTTYTLSCDGGEFTDRVEILILPEFQEL